MAASSGTAGPDFPASRTKSLVGTSFLGENALEERVNFWKLPSFAAGFES